MNPFFQPWNILYEYMMDHDPDAKRMTPTQRRNCAAFIVQWVEHCVEDYRDIAGERLPSSVAADHHISILSCKENNIQSALLYAVIDVDRR
ncbi:hypothetical protein LSG31_16645 [Fodinisporobacter ferrooxydans]|uniref:Uncharacterized protein n=1 Tax=Fodinisporobacter ferrooxydans TaxID=2901836 RepID=A0ABY4CJ90_9BACL|nr:hypothetical protein LSG31_16645 [Alicyclobacillaceae bacterium MYW30-H2]